MICDAFVKFSRRSGKAYVKRLATPALTNSLTFFIFQSSFHWALGLGVWCEFSPTWPTACSMLICLSFASHQLIVWLWKVVGSIPTVSMSFAPLRPWRHCFCFICCLGVLLQVDCEASFAKPLHLVRNMMTVGNFCWEADTASKLLEEANSGTFEFF